ncbi:MAG: nucleotidyltransferase family protein [Alphaproteobacteria bacterium]|nr:nucleotidyltransferase family protein [Alphaproteobacteria bacterium]
MSKALPTTAMVLAAGLGTRLRPLTESCPKPLIPVQGMPMIFRTLQAVARSGVQRAVVNTHHFGARLQAEVSAAQHQGRFGPLHVMFSPEPVLLETGGGIKHALPLLGEGPLLVVNSDAVWDEARAPLLQPLLQAWVHQPPHAQALLALVSTARTQAFQPQGDFLLEEDGTLNRDGERSSFGHIYAGAHVTETEKIAAFGLDKFSLNLVWEAMRAEHGLKGWVYDAPWCEMGTHEGLARATHLLSGG